MTAEPITAIEALDDGARAALLALNDRHRAETSPLDRARLDAMVHRAFRASAIGVDAFLIVFDETADYDSPNFLWFRDRFERFAYVDRVVTGEATRGRGLARRLYEDAFARARAAGHERVVCEVNRVPSNPGSDAFHARMGFAAIGEATRPGGKTVRFMERGLGPQHAPRRTRGPPG